ncbi:hypothetical protein Tco_0267095 [Tanacetum coccineum]
MEKKADEKRLEDIPVVKEFPDVFPEDIYLVEDEFSDSKKPHDHDPITRFGIKNGDKEIYAEGMDMEIELSNLGTVNTMFAALFRALNGTVKVRLLRIGSSVSGKVDEQAQSGIILLYSEQDNGGGYSIALQVGRANLVSAGEKEVCETVPSVSKVGPLKFELQMGCK